jgi:hypothetical protein
LAAGLIVLGVVARLVPHPPNATPVMAIALFGGTYLARRWAILLPMAILVASDLVLGWHPDIAFKYAAFALTGTLAFWIRPSPTPGRILTAAVAGSLLFFVVTNVGVWAAGGLYPPTPAGLRECFVLALPFYRNTLMGDLAYTAALFGLAALISRRLTARQPARIN